ncbi:MAG: sulfotransferase domain-containing protein [Candidatus Aminicenantes bacterium]|nr:MAG: sulfotransferase domain-containing protein [Candidatus Aminicenantes bacterium]
MKKISILRSMDKFLSYLPFIEWMVRRWKVRSLYAVERQILKGKHRAKSDRQSIIFFTVHKAGSSFIGSILKKIVIEAGLTPVDLDGYFFNLGKGDAWEGGGRINRKIYYCPNGYSYGPFRSFNQGISNLDDYKIILVLRDPRDVIVSSYYSLYSHAFLIGEGKKKQKIRMNRREDKWRCGIDQFVINKLKSRPSYLDNYYKYYFSLIGKPNVLFLKYENMVTDFETWLDKLLKFLDLNTSPHLKDEIINLSDLEVGRDNIYKHKRQVLPGDHRLKLKKETIEILNSESQEILELFDY